MEVRGGILELNRVLLRSSPKTIRQMAEVSLFRLVIVVQKGVSLKASACVPRLSCCTGNKLCMIRNTEHDSTKLREDRPRFPQISRNGGARDRKTVATPNRRYRS